MQNYFDNEATSSALHATMKPARGGKCLVTLSTYEDRKEALLNTTILDDDSTIRSKGPKINSLTQQRQQNDTLDGRETKQETYSHIPKPPPLQMTNNSNSYKTNNNNLTSQTTTAKNNTNDHTANQQQQRLSINTQNGNGNLYSPNDTYSRPNKMSTQTTNGFSSTNNQTNRQTLRLGTVTIGEYSQPTSRREPGKFDFIATQKKGRESGDTTPTNEALQNELQSTLSRANLRKSNGNGYTEHQRNCPLLQQTMDYGNNGFTVEEMSKKLQKSSINDNNRPINNATGTGVGILKNGNRNGSSNSSKSTEKSIKFG